MTLKWIRLQSLAVLVTVLLSCSVVLAQNNVPAASIQSGNLHGAATEHVPERSVAGNKTSGYLEARNQPDCKPSTVTITQSVVSTTIVTTTISGGGAGGGGAPGGSPTQGKPATTSPPDPKSPPAPGGGGGNSKSCSCPHTTTVAFEGDKPPPRRARRQVGGACPCTVTASRIGPPLAPSPSDFTGQKTPLEGALPLPTPVTSVYTSTLPGGALTTITTVLTSSASSVPSNSAKSDTSTVITSIFTTTPPGGSATVITTVITQAATASEKRQAAQPTSADPVPMILKLARRVAFWDDFWGNGQGAWNTDSKNITVKWIPPAYPLHFATYHASPSSIFGNPASVIFCNITGPPTKGFELGIMPDSPYLQNTTGLDFECWEKCSEVEMKIDLPAEMTYTDTLGKTHNGPSASVVEVRPCSAKQHLISANVTLQTFAQGQNGASGFPVKDISCVLSGRLLSTDKNPSIKLQPQAPYFVADSSLTNRTDGISLQCRDGPAACPQGAEMRKIRLIAREGTQIGFDKKDQVDQWPTLVGGPEDTWIQRGCDANPTKVSFRIFKSDVKREDYGKATPEKKATCEISGYPSSTSTSIAFNATQPFYTVHADSGLWMTCKEEK